MLHSVRSKLFVMQDGAWVERGTGLLKLNATKDGDKTGARLGKFASRAQILCFGADPLTLLQLCAPMLPTAFSLTRPSSPNSSSRSTRRNTSASPSSRAPSLSAICYGCVVSLFFPPDALADSLSRRSSPGPPTRRTSYKLLEIVPPYSERLPSPSFFLSWIFGRPFAVFIRLAPLPVPSSSSTSSLPRLPLFVALICKESRSLSTAGQLGNLGEQRLSQ